VAGKLIGRGGGGHQEGGKGREDAVGACITARGAEISEEPLRGISRHGSNFAYRLHVEAVPRVDPLQQSPQLERG
jgi:hypothetical protein